MKTLRLLLSMAIIGMFAISCDDEDVSEAGDDRPQVTSLSAVPGDEEVELSWGVPDGCYPTDFIVYYNDTNSDTITLYTGGAMTYTVTGLENGVQYTFYVQAVYGTLISNPVNVSATPSTVRFPVTDLVADAGDQYIILTWTKPGTAVLHYTLSWYNEKNTSDVTTVTLDADVTTYTLEDLENDLNYYITLIAVYEKGESDPTTLRAMPTTVIPYTLDRDKAALYQPVTFTFNTEGYPDATDIKWTFPGNEVVTGNSVQHTFTSTGIQTTTLSATIEGASKSWSIEVEIREYVVFNDDWVQNDSTYNGFKGGNIVFSPDGQTVYALTFNAVTALYAYDVITGEEKWRYVPAVYMSSYNPFTVNPVTGDIYFGGTSAGYFYAVTSEGELKWTFSGAQSMKSCAPAVSADGSKVFIIDASGNAFALDTESGSQIWKNATGSAAGSGLLVNGDELIVGATSKILFLSTSTGEEVAEAITLDSNMTDITGFAVSPDKKTAYLPTLGGYISTIDLDAHKKGDNSCAVSGTNVRLYEIAVAPNGTLFCADYASYVYNVSADLTKVNWSYRIYNGNYGANYSRPCVDNKNQFYITSGQTLNVNYIFDANGSVVDQYSVGTGNEQAQMGGNNILDGVYYGCFTGNNSNGQVSGAFFGKYVGAERADTWCSSGGDICGSNCIK